MKVSVLAGSRFELALERFLRGEDTLNFGFFALGLDQNGDIGVGIVSRTMTPTEASAKADLKEAKAAIDDLVCESSAVREAIEARPRKEDGQFEWKGL